MANKNQFGRAFKAHHFFNVKGNGLPNPTMNSPQRKHDSNLSL